MNNEPDSADRSEIVLLIHGLGGTQHGPGMLEYAPKFGARRQDGGAQPGTHRVMPLP